MFLFKDVGRINLEMYQIVCHGNFGEHAHTSQARDIYNADNKTEAIKAFKRWSKIWRPISVKTV